MLQHTKVGLIFGVAMSLKLIVTALSTFFLVGCATPTPWMHSSKFQSDFNQDDALCNMQANNTTQAPQRTWDARMDPIQKSSAAIADGMAGMGHALALRNNYDLCMRAKGYYK